MTIIIPSCTDDNLWACLQAIEDLDPEWLSHVVVMDTGLDSLGSKGVLWAGREVQIDHHLLGAPFNFAATINCAMEFHQDDHYLILNDDAILQTPKGISLLCRKFVEIQCQEGKPTLGILSASVKGVSCNPNLFPEELPSGALPFEPPLLRWERNMVPFICTMISRECVEYTGRLDERFTGYGCEDTDFCHRAMMAGFHIAIWQGCVVEHESLPSTFRTREGWNDLYEKNKGVFEKKWKTPHLGPPTGEVDILFLSHNRYGYTEKALRCLTKNTTWSRVGKVYFWDDSSTDGTLALVRDKASIIGLTTRHEVQSHEFGGSVTPLRQFIQESNASYLVKIDCDTCVPPLWLDRCMDVMDRNPNIGLLGLEPYIGYSMDPLMRRGWKDAGNHVGGIGVFRRRVFETKDPETLDLPVQHQNKYSGWTEWQHQHPQVIKAWLDPGLPVVLLDRVPDGSWRKMGKQYVIEGWQRDWKRYEKGESIYQWL